VEGGKITLNAQRPKPSKEIKTGDALQIRIGAFEHRVTVLALSEKRGPAAEAAKLYVEDEASKSVRQALAAQLRASAAVNPFLKGRPTKKARRDLQRLQERDTAEQGTEQE
jgi:ribosome-associated heat shock protein Hsp15